MKKNITSGIAICLFLSLAAFSNASQETKTEKGTDNKPAAASAPSATADSSLSGKVLETMDAGGYTYIKLDTSAQQIWVAIPQTAVKVGDEITCSPGMAMQNFSSKSLNRTFETIVFSSGVVGAKGGGHSGMQASMTAPHTPKAKQGGDDSFASAVQAEGGAPAMQQPQAGSGGSLGAMAPFSEVAVEKAAGENGYTIEEIFSKTEELNGKTVRIQGKVVKYSPMIMGRNWIHLQDGTGDPMNNTHDLVVTTSEEVENDTVITIEGVLVANKDFGAGYKYVVIVEEAKTLK